MKRSLVITIILSVVFLFQKEGKCQTNEGTEFWFSFLEHRNPRLNTKVVMITSRTNTRGTITAPLDDFNQSFTVSANDVTIIELPEYAETFGSETISDNGFKIVSDDLVSVYIHQYYQYRAEATMVLPVSALDKSYYALSYTGYTADGEVFPSQMILVATQDDTNIEVQLKGGTQGGRSAGDVIELTLDAGETYQVQGGSASDDLSGSFISGDKNFSVFCGNRYTALNCFRGGRDNLLEQSFPISTWGTKFVSAPFQENIDDIFRIIASENNTEIELLFQNGVSHIYALDAGEFVEFENRLFTYIESNRPILVAQYMNQLECGNGRSGDPSMVYLNSVLQIRDTVTLYNSSFQNIEENYISIITRSSDIDNVFLDGQAVSNLISNFQFTGKNNEFAAATIRVNTGAHTITSAGCGVIAKAFGLGMYESYAYSGGASFSKINASPIPDGGCLNDTVFFATGLPAERYTVKWIFASGDTMIDHEFTRIYDELGLFGAELFIHDHCFDLFDTLSKDLSITLRASVDTDPIDPLCEGYDVRLSATDVNNATYQWTGPNEYFAEEQEPIIEGANPSDNGIYEVIGIVSGCATVPAQINIEVNPTPHPNLGEDGVFCPEGEKVISISPGAFSNYRWSDRSTSSELIVNIEGEIIVEVEDEFGCIASDTVIYIQQCPTRFTVPNIFSPNGDNLNDMTGVYGEDVISIDFGIYDAWGNEVFRSVDIDKLWDGKFQDEDVEAGVYAWGLNLEGYEEDGSVFSRWYKGNITVIR